MDKLDTMYQCVGKQDESAQDECGFLQEDRTSGAHVRFFLTEQMRYVLL